MGCLNFSLQTDSPNIHFQTDALKQNRARCELHSSLLHTPVSTIIINMGTIPECSSSRTPSCNVVSTTTLFPVKGQPASTVISLWWFAKTCRSSGTSSVGEPLCVPQHQTQCWVMTGSCGQEQHWSSRGWNYWLRGVSSLLGISVPVVILTNHLHLCCGLESNLIAICCPLLQPSYD